MATVVFPLLNGFSDAPSGTAVVYKIGTSSPATLYDYSSAGIESVIGSGSVTLDASGRRRCYVKERVDVVIQNASGSEVIRFPFGMGDDMIEVESAVFTGTLSSGSQGAGGKALLSTKLDLLYTSWGATNGLVRKTGGTSDQFLKDALVASATSIFYNVKESTYGALGDGSTDDFGAIQAAIDAAVAAGGGIVFFPEGTYKILTSLLIASQKVVLLGVGHRASIIRNHSTSGNLLSISSGASSDCGIVLENLAMIANSTSTGIAVNASQCNGIELRNCRIDNHSTGVQADSRVRVLGGYIGTNTSGTCRAIDFVSTGTGGGSEVIGCNIVLSTTDNDQYAIRVERPDVHIEDCQIDCSAAGGTSACIGIDNAAAAGTVVRGNKFTAGSGNYGMYVTANVSYYELGNRAASGTLFGADTSLTTATPQVRVSQQWATTAHSQSGGTYSANQDVGYHLVENTNAGGGTITLEAGSGTPTHGARMVITVRNSGGGGAQGVTAGTDLTPEGASMGVIIPTGEAATFEWVYCAHADIASFHWLLISGYTAAGANIPYVA